jgi:predicted pyridoxine 5'-phosphate oxidase superfamily flavin-nucleotide-binding protein
MGQTQQSAAELDASPFHDGEREIQTLAGVREEAEKRGQRMLSAELNAQQLQFFAQLPFVITAHVDENGQPWAGLVTGSPGFITFTELNRQCSIDFNRANNTTALKVGPGSEIGLLGIELATRRRNRLNGIVFASHDNQCRLLIQQGYGNCPKYITERAWPSDLFARPYAIQTGEGLSEAALKLAHRSDTFFIATSSGPNQGDTRTRESAWGADASHRGGEPGFLSSDGSGLTFEDFPGNNMFNTLGNLQQYTKCGLLLIDFESGDLVQLAAEGRIEHTDESRRIRLNILETRHWSQAHEMH